MNLGFAEKRHLIAEERSMPLETVVPVSNAAEETSRPHPDETADVLQVLAALVKFDTTSSRSNLPMIAWMESRLRQSGFRTERIVSLDGRKASLIASIGPDAPNGYVLSGHSDTVPVDGQRWSTNPHELRIASGKAYGRGACDMKGFLAACLAAAPAMAEAPLRRPLHFIVTYDEEVGCVGAKQMCAILRDRNWGAAGCFVGEPTDMDVIIGHKSKRNLRAQITGLACHSSLAPRGVNAVQWGARLVVELDRIAARLIAKGAQDAAYDIPHTTVHVGIFNGGQALNIVPAEAEVAFEIRAIDADDPDRLIETVQAIAREKIEPAMRRIDSRAGLSITVDSSTPGLENDSNAPIVNLAKMLAGRRGHGKVAFMTEAGLFQKVVGIPTVVIGPGSIAQAHTPDEWIAIDQIRECSAFICNLIDHCCR